jgi:hypothetical protein
MFFHGGFIEFIGIPLNDLYGILGTLAEACTQTVAKVVCVQHCLAIDELDGALGTGRNAEAAAVTFIRIDCHYVADHDVSFIPLS